MSFIDFSTYSDHQQIINSDRIIVNAKKDSAFIIAKKTVGISANEELHVNVGDKVIVNAPEIQFGLSKDGKLEPVTKADTTAEILNDILAALNSFSSQLASAAGMGAGVVSLPTINTAATKLSADVIRISKKVENIK